MTSPLIAGMPASAWFMVLAVGVVICAFGLFVLRQLQNRRRHDPGFESGQFVDAWKLFAVALVLPPIFHLLCWLVYAQFLYEPGPVTLKDMPDSHHAEVIWEDKLFSLRTYFPVTVVVSVAVGIVVLLSLTHRTFSPDTQQEDSDGGNRHTTSP